MRKTSCLMAFWMLACGWLAVASQAEPAGPRNLILMIGDGLGVAQVTAARVAQGKLQLERYPVGGLVATHSANQFITDSGAAGTALATGVKTNNQKISTTVDGEVLPTVLQIAAGRGLRTGVVVTCNLTHATPASFMTHAASRKELAEIARQIVDAPADVLIGGGREIFAGRWPEDGSPRQGRPLVDLLAERRPVLTTEQAFAGHLPDGKGFVALLADDHLPPAPSTSQLDLATLTAKALADLAKSGQPFLLIVEGSQIDWAGHANKLSQVIAETVDFDAAAGVAIDFAERDGRTLVVVTSDHETGGLTLLAGNLAKRQVEGHFSSGNHTGEMVPLFAFGPGATAFGGIRDNTDIGRQLIELVNQVPVE